MSRIQITDLPANCELDTDEARSVQGGLGVVVEDLLISSYQTSGVGRDMGRTGGSPTQPGTSNGIIAILIEM